MNIRHFIDPFYENRDKPVKSALTFFALTFLVYFFIQKSLFDFVLKLVDLDLIGFARKSSSGSQFTLFTFILDILVSTYEEMMFRWGLKFSILRVTTFIFGSCHILVNIFIPYELFADTQILFLYIFILIFCFGVIWRVVIKHQTKLTEVWAKKRKIILLYSIITFSLSHLFNYNITNTFRAIFFTPILLFPYVFAGYYYSLLRLKFSTILSIIGHTSYNVLNRFIAAYFHF